MTCPNQWNQIAAIGSDGFTFGSSDTLRVVQATREGAAYDYTGSPINVTGNAIVEQTFPHSGQIALGAAAGVAPTNHFQTDTVFAPIEPFGRLQGNRAKATLTRIFPLAGAIGPLAPGILTASCTVTLSSPAIYLNAGDPAEGGPFDSLVYACGQVTIDVIAGPRVRTIIPTADRWKSSSRSITLFTRSGTGTYEDPRGFGGTGPTGYFTTIDDIDGNDLSQPFEIYPVKPATRRRRFDLHSCIG